MKLLITIALFGTVSASCRPGQSSPKGRHVLRFSDFLVFLSKKDKTDLSIIQPCSKGNGTNANYTLSNVNYTPRKIRYGGHLASIANAAEQPLIVEATKNGGMCTSENVWIGLRNASNGHFAWEDGTPYSFNKFGPDVGSGQCVVYQLSTQQWRLDDCSSTHASVCISDAEQPPTTCPTCPPPPGPRCDEGWKYFNGNCYKMIRNAKDGDQVKPACERLGANITSIHSEAENNFVVSVAMDGIFGETKNQDQYQVFIGVHRLDKTGYFYNHDKTPLDFTKWAEKKPQHSGNKCVEIYTVDLSKNRPRGNYIGYWNDAECRRDRAAVCKKASHY